MSNLIPNTYSGGAVTLFDPQPQAITPSIQGMNADDCMAFLEYQLDSVNNQFSQIANDANRSAAAAQVLNELSAKMSKYTDIDNRKDGGNSGDAGKDADNAKNADQCKDVVRMIQEAEAQLPQGAPELAKLKDMEAYFQQKADGPDFIVNKADMGSQMSTLQAMSSAAGNDQSMKMTEVQVLTNRMARVNELISNIIHKIDESLSTSVNNIK